MQFDADYASDIAIRMADHETFTHGRNDIANEEELTSEKFQAHLIWLEEAGLIKLDRRMKDPAVNRAPHMEGDLNSPARLTFNGQIFVEKMRAVLELKKLAEVSESHTPNLGYPGMSGIFG